VIRDISRSYILRFLDKGAKECVVIEGQRENVGNDTEAGRLGPLVEDVDWARRRDSVRFDVFVFQRIILVVVTTAFDDGARPGRSVGTEENEKGVLETLSLDRIVISTDYPVIVQHSESVVIVYCCPELADLGEFVVVLQSTMDILGTVSSTGLSGRTRSSPTDFMSFAIRCRSVAPSSDEWPSSSVGNS
jgi:hypothetical protein